MILIIQISIKRLLDDTNNGKHMFSIKHFKHYFKTHKLGQNSMELENRNKIYVLYESKINMKLQKRTGIAYSTVCHIIRRKNNDISQDLQSGSGKRSVL